MQKIIPHLWYDKEARQAAELYVGVFPDSKINAVHTITDTPSGDCDIVSFELMGYQFQSISAGPYFELNPSISFMVRCKERTLIDALHATLSDGGKELMPLGEYPFSEHYAWVQDRWGVNWQLMLNDEEQSITPSLMFVGGRAGEVQSAMEFYAGIFPNSSIEAVSHYGDGALPDLPNDIQYAQLTLAGQKLVMMESRHEHQFGFNEGVSLIVNCEDQAEIDYYWQALSAVPGAEQCGWLKDKYGVSWQIIPIRMEEIMKTPAQTQAMLQMKKIIIADLEAAK